MTDNEIIKAFAYCVNAEECDFCPLFGKCPSSFALSRMALDVINRQKAENERLCMELDEVIIAKDLLFDEAEALIKKTKAEAVKEFAERLKLKVDIDLCEAIECSDYLYNLPKLIDNLIKEMVGEQE